MCILSQICIAVISGALLFHNALAESPTPSQPPGTQTLTTTPTRAANTQTPTPIPTRFPNAPADFHLIAADIGVQLFRKDYPNGSPDFVQIVDLSLGARLELMHGQIVEPRTEKGVYGHADPRMTSLPIQSYWQQAFSQDEHTLCVTNGSFFYMREYPTRLAFPLKVDDHFVTDGFGNLTYLGQKLMLELWEDHADIRELTKDALNQSSASNIIGGLTEQANKRAKSAVGRTFTGVADRDRDGLYETVLLVNTKTALQTSVAAVLRSFGADRVMMLDGGGSTQLLCREGHYIASDRPIPQVIAVIAAEPPPISTEVIQKPEWPILLEGENFLLDLVIQNTGTVTWTPATTHFYIKSNQLGGQDLHSIVQEVSPSQTATFTQTLAAFSKEGVHTVHFRWGIVYDDKLYYGEPIKFQAIVLPPILNGKRVELQEELNQWSAEQPGKVEELATKWIQNHEMPGVVTIETETLEGIHMEDVAIIPLVMIPVIIILAVVIGKLQS